VGIDANYSKFLVSWYGLDRELWSDGDRSVICTAEGVGYETGSIKGSRR
jgi:hypothetical protein